MEIALEGSIPTYSGGLGVLAGDTLRAAADLGVPMVGVTLVHRKGYFRQCLDGKGNQSEEDAAWHPEKLLEPVEDHHHCHNRRAGCPYPCLALLCQGSWWQHGFSLSAGHQPSR